MARETAIGIIGTGIISETYLRMAPSFRDLKIVACADIIPEKAAAKAKQFGIRAVSVDDLLKDDEIEVVINLTVPNAHYAVSKAILSAGKHAYSEKPFSVSNREASRLVAEADRRGLKIGCAPDTFLGAGGQTTRRLIDKGVIGKVVSGTAMVFGHGMEHWHPNPDFFFQPGGGPMLDVGPYYATALVHLLGPVKAVTAMATSGFAHRLVTSDGPMKGRRVKVTTPTTLNAVLQFHSGAEIALVTSWDVWKHGHPNRIELYGTEGSMLVPDPNYFGGVIRHSHQAGAYTEIDTDTMAFGAPNYQDRSGNPALSNYRMLGVADLIDAARRDREPRCSGRLAAHVAEVLLAALKSAETGRVVAVKSKVERPRLLSPADMRRFGKPEIFPADAA